MTNLTLDDQISYQQFQDQHRWPEADDWASMDQMYSWLWTIAEELRALVSNSVSY